MINKKILHKFTHGMYVLTTNGGGCFVDAVAQVSAGINPLIIVSVMKSNYTNELMHNNKDFALSIFGIDNDSKIIKTFGAHSMRDFDKFDEVDLEVINGLNIIKDSIGYVICEKIDTIENETHTVFIGRVIEGDVLEDNEPMTYGYYQEHKDDLMKIKTEEGKTAWVCTVCGFIYYGDELPNDYKCPMCGVSKDFFERKESN